MVWKVMYEGISQGLSKGSILLPGENVLAGRMAENSLADAIKVSCDRSEQL